MKGIVLKASAGTGKTYRLSLEYIISLLMGEKYNNILVMTFTKKATSEIRERIMIFLEKLYKSEENLEEANELLENLKVIYSKKELGTPLDLSKENIKRVYQDILVNKDRLKIYTIDGFINNIFKSVISPYLKVYSYDVENDSEEEIYLKCFEKIIKNRSDFDKFKTFLQNRTDRNLDNYISLLKKLIPQV